MKAKAVERAPAGLWSCEVKYDGYRLVTRVTDQAVTLLTRRGNDWTDRFPTVADAVRSLAWEA